MDNVRTLSQLLGQYVPHRTSWATDEEHTLLMLA